MRNAPALSATVMLWATLVANVSSAQEPNTTQYVQMDAWLAFPPRTGGSTAAEQASYCVNQRLLPPAIDFRLRVPEVDLRRRSLLCISLQSDAELTCPDGRFQLLWQVSQAPPSVWISIDTHVLGPKMVPRAVYGYELSLRPLEEHAILSGILLPNEGPAKLVLSCSSDGSEVWQKVWRYQQGSDAQDRQNDPNKRHKRQE